MTVGTWSAGNLHALRPFECALAFGEIMTQALLVVVEFRMALFVCAAAAEPTSFDVAHVEGIETY